MASPTTPAMTPPPTYPMCARSGTTPTIGACDRGHRIRDGGDERRIHQRAADSEQHRGDRGHGDDSARGCEHDKRRGLDEHPGDDERLAADAV